MDSIYMGLLGEVREVHAPNSGHKAHILHAYVAWIPRDIKQNAMLVIFPTQIIICRNP